MSAQTSYSQTPYSISIEIIFSGEEGRGGGEWGRVGDPIYGLNSYVPPDRVWFLRVSILYKSIIFSVVGVVFPV